VGEGSGGLGSLLRLSAVEDGRSGRRSRGCERSVSRVLGASECFKRLSWARRVDDALSDEELAELRVIPRLYDVMLFACEYFLGVLVLFLGIVLCVFAKPGGVGSDEEREELYSNMILVFNYKKF